MTQHFALLLTDLVDSTQLSQAAGDAEMARWWAAHDRAARDLLPIWRGREIDKSDGLFLLFESVLDALSYALAYHRVLATLGLPLKARVGVHVGPVTLRENPPADILRGAKPLEVEGLAKPTVARVMAVATGGQTLLTADACAELLAGLRAELHATTPGRAAPRLLSHGFWRLRGLAEPIELFEAGDDDADDGGAPFTPPPDGAKAYRVLRQGALWLPVREVRHSLPAERDSFVGQHQPLLNLARKLDGGARLVSVLGMGGTGKTRLVLHFAWAWLGDYPGGLWFCDLSQARGVDGILAAVAQGLDVPLGRGDPVVQLGNAIHGRGLCLVILDNFEQVARHAEATLGRWLERAPLARFVVTTREVLGIVGEQVLALAPLAMADAATLFRQRSDAARQGLPTAPDDLAAIDQLVTVLDGLPLAIELAAARARVMPPRMLLARMNERFKLLWSRSGRQDRQATLRGAFDWSWELLLEAERIALAQLSVFRGGFTLASASAVLDMCAADSPPWPPDVVLSLVEKSFVRQLADDRFDLLESVREYAAEHLCTEGRFAGSGPGAALAAERRHAGFFAPLEPQAEVNPAIVELDNLVVACRRAALGQDTGLAERTLSGAWALVRLRGPFRLGLELAQAVRATAGLGGLAMAKVAMVQGAALELCGQMPEAHALFEQALALAVALGDRHQEARARHGLAGLLAKQGQAHEAAVFGESALALAQALDDPALNCAVHNGLGEVCESLGHTDAARQHYETALRLAQQAGDRRWEGGTAGNLAQLHANQGRPALARPLYEQAVRIALAIGDRQWEANNRCNLGLLHHAEGRLAQARTELAAALLAARDMGHARLQAIVQCNLGLVEEAAGQVGPALAYHEAAAALARELGDRRSEGQCLGYLGLLHAHQARPDQARACLATGESLLRAVDDPLSLGILMCGRAEAAWLADDAAAAHAAWATCSGLAQELDPVEPASEFGLALARVGQWFNAVA